MRLLVDECTGGRVVRWLRKQGHDVLSVAELHAGMDDNEVLAWANNENRILITADTDFGEKVFSEGLVHQGIILLRLRRQISDERIKALHRLLSRYPNDLNGQYVVVTDALIRFARQR